MNRFAETLVKMIDEDGIFDVAKYFGGIEKMLKLSEKYPYLQSLIKTKLGGVLYCSVPNEDEIMIPFELPFIMTELESIDDDDDSNSYNATVDIIIPELTEKKDMQILMTWLEDYLSDMGAEVGSFNDGKLNQKWIWVYADKINDMTFESLRGAVSDSEVLKIIPKEYLRD
jgi:hypothetical protein